jgi:hypothetical protein
MRRALIIGANAREYYVGNLGQWDGHADEALAFLREARSLVTIRILNPMLMEIAFGRRGTLGGAGLFAA